MRFLWTCFYNLIRNVWKVFEMCFPRLAHSIQQRVYRLVNLIRNTWKYFVSLPTRLSDMCDRLAKRLAPKPVPHTYTPLAPLEVLGLVYIGWAIYIGLIPTPWNFTQYCSELKTGMGEMFDRWLNDLWWGVQWALSELPQPGDPYSAWWESFKTIVAAIFNYIRGAIFMTGPMYPERQPSSDPYIVRFMKSFDLFVGYRLSRLVFSLPLLIQKLLGFSYWQPKNPKFSRLTPEEVFEAGYTKRPSPDPNPDGDYPDFLKNMSPEDSLKLIRMFEANVNHIRETASALKQESLFLLRTTPAFFEDVCDFYHTSEARGMEEVCRAFATHCNISLSYDSPIYEYLLDNPWIDPHYVYILRAVDTYLRVSDWSGIK